jgi:hypothetical protein
MIGEICSYPGMKTTVTKSTRVITFFNGSHYWGGQLKEEAKKHKVNRSLKKNCETRFYALSLQALSVIGNQYVNVLLCLVPETESFAFKEPHFNMSASDRMCRKRQMDYPLWHLMLLRQFFVSKTFGHA